MLLSQTAEYAIRAMSCLAVRADGEVVRAAEIGEEAQIPLHYLSKILRKLVASRLLTAAKGHGGGFAFARAPEKIRLIDIIEAVETPVPAKHCIFGWRICNSANPCILHHRWSTVNDAFQTWIRSTTIAEIKQDAIGNGWLVRTASARSDERPNVKSGGARRAAEDAGPARRSRRR